MVAPLITPVVWSSDPANEPGGGSVAGGLPRPPNCPAVMVMLNGVVAAAATVADRPTNEPATTAMADRPARTRTILLFTAVPPRILLFIGYMRPSSPRSGATIAGQSDMATMVAVWARAVPAEVALPNWNT